jgi:hypothetical protein
MCSAIGAMPPGYAPAALSKDSTPMTTGAAALSKWVSGVRNRAIGRTAAVMRAGPALPRPGPSRGLPCRHGVN